MVVSNSSVLSSIIPQIRRARGYRLYDHRGKRYVDMFQNGGHAILGHRPKGLFSTVKNTIEKGLLAPYPSIYEHRLMKLLGDFFPKAGGFYIFSNKERALLALSSVCGIDYTALTIDDPLTLNRNNGSQLRLWRPYLDDKAEPALFTLPVIPFPGMCEPVIICTRKGFNPPKGTELQSDSISPVILSGIIKVFHALKGRDLKKEQEKWSFFDFPFWKREGLYLIADNIEENRYQEIFKALLERGILISPDPAVPSIIPGEFSYGEMRPLGDVLG